MWPLLLASLAINLVIAGAVIGQRWRGHQGPRFGGGEAAQAHRFARQLPPERRAAIQKIFESHRGEFREYRQEIRRKRDDVDRVLQAEPFDQKAYIAAINQALDVSQKMRLAVQPMFAEVAALMTPAERREFVKFQGQLHRVFVPSNGERGAGRGRMGDDDRGPGGGPKPDSKP